MWVRVGGGFLKAAGKARGGLGGPTGERTAFLLRPESPRPALARPRAPPKPAGSSPDWDRRKGAAAGLARGLGWPPTRPRAHGRAKKHTLMNF
eukprot:10866560-Alexandrium_andersonii.AAC.1